MDFAIESHQLSYCWLAALPKRRYGRGLEPCGEYTVVVLYRLPVDTSLSGMVPVPRVQIFLQLHHVTRVCAPPINQLLVSLATEESILMVSLSLLAISYSSPGLYPIVSA